MMSLRSIYDWPVKMAGVLFFAGFCMCESSFQPVQYVSLESGTKKRFSGILGATSISRSNESDIFRMEMSDSSSQYRGTAQLVRDNDQVFVHTFDPQIPSIPAFTFDPPLPVGPFSATIGEQRCVESVETRNDSLDSSYGIQVCFYIESIDRIQVPAGDFQNCIRMRVDYVYLEHPERPYLEGQYLQWFAKETGLVRYSFNGQIGELLEF